MLGTDPEFAIRSRSGKFIPAHRVLGDDAHKHRVAPGVVAFRDGYMVELNVSPQANAADLVKYVQLGIRGVNRMLPSAWELCTNAAITIDLKDLKRAPEDVRHFGCNPSYCAYSGEAKLLTLDPMTLEMRSAGAHMHFSATAEEAETPAFAWLLDKDCHRQFIKMMDFYVGLPLARIFHAPGQYRRRTLYGQAGEYRPQEYPDGSLGLEYRTPPPQLWNSAEIAVQAFCTGEAVFNNFYKFRRIWDPQIESALQRAINTGEGRESLPLSGVGFTEKLIEKYFSHPVYRLFQLPYQQL